MIPIVRMPLLGIISYFPAIYPKESGKSVLIEPRGYRDSPDLHQLCSVVWLYQNDNY